MEKIKNSVIDYFTNLRYYLLLSMIAVYAVGVFTGMLQYEFLGWMIRIFAMTVFSMEIFKLWDK